MKKIVAGFFISSIILIAACHKKSVPNVTSRKKQPSAPSKSHMVYTAADIAGGKIVYETKCAKCHEPKPVNLYTTERWVGLLRSMIPKSKLDSLQKVQVTAYVNTNAKNSRKEMLHG
ncbi:MAG: hypothetical protein WDN26_07970 [Chitinophagaceae bacterium]